MSDISLDPEFPAVPSVPYAVREAESEHICGYAVKHPTSGDIVSNRSFKDGYCEQPLTMLQAEADALAAQMSAKTGVAWVSEVAPCPCPNCGRVIWADDLDFCYPQNRERTLWRAGCNEHDFGCGHELYATTYDEVMNRWNGVAP